MVQIYKKITNIPYSENKKFLAKTITRFLFAICNIYFTEKVQSTIKIGWTIKLFGDFESITPNS